MKLPVSCESLSGMRPVQLIGGEQTLFAVTADGKVCNSPLVSSADVLCKQFGPRSGPTKCRA